MSSSNQSTVRADYTGKGKYGIIAKALNRLGTWVNRIHFVAPLMKHAGPDGSISVALQTQALASLILAQMSHPWQLTSDGLGGYKIRGGSVLAGTEMVPVAGISTSVPAGGSRIWWLYVKYPNDTSSPTAEIKDGSSLPSATYDVDELPGDPVCDAVNLSGWCEIIVPLAEVTAGEPVQYQYSDILLPRGRTITVTRVVDHFWDGGTLKHALVTETYVNGVLRTITGPSCKEVFQTGDCPDDSPELTGTGG